MLISQLRNTRVVDLFIIGIFVALSFWIRTQQLQAKLYWDYDRSRDILASYQIWKYDERPLVGHHASGFETVTKAGDKTVLKYPAGYYYYLSLLWQIGQSLDGFLVVNALAFSLSVITVYSIGKQLNGSLAGLLAAALFALSEKYVYDSSTIIGLQVGVPIYLLAITFYIRSLLKKKRVLNVLSLIMIVVATSFHYSLLIFFVFLFFLAEYRFNRSFWQWLGGCAAYGTLYVGIFFYIHIPVIVFFGWNEFLQGIFNQGSKQPVALIALQLISLLRSHFITIFPTHTLVIGSLSVAAFLVSLVSGNKQVRRTLIALSYVVFFLLIMGSLNVEKYPDQIKVQTELAVFGILLIISISLATVVKKLKSNVPIAAYGFALLAGILCVIASSNKYSYLQGYPKEHSYAEFQELTQYILFASNTDQIAPSVYSESFRYGEMALSFPLEVLTASQHVRFGEYYEYGMTNTNPWPKYAVVACDASSVTSNKDEFCKDGLSQYQEKYANYHVISNGVCFGRYDIYWLVHDRASSS